MNSSLRERAAVLKAQYAARRRELRGLTREGGAHLAEVAQAAKALYADPRPLPALPSEAAARQGALLGGTPPEATPESTTDTGSLRSAFPEPAPAAEPAPGFQARYLLARQQLREASATAAGPAAPTVPGGAVSPMVTPAAGAREMADAAQSSGSTVSAGGAGESRLLTALHELRHTVERNHREALDRRPHVL